ncbi:unnamed protein product [Blepharisma stoltei]|uniref:Ankyrin repeat domain-containing protein n=1 Tax=Blepharisma stoltei TaxID=1481888 RepID=A0AAU9JFI1_9CILI|nr:unnamed protein product [Blepharisma stoltei]
MSIGLKTEILGNKQENIERANTSLKSKNINYKNSYGHTPLALAVKEGHLETVWELINQGADINATNDVGQSILFLACWHNRENLAKLLIDKNAKIDLADNRGWTPLTISVYHNYTNIIEILLNAGCNVEYKDCFGKTPAERAKNIDTVILLQKAAESRKNKRWNLASSAKNPTENLSTSLDSKYKEILAGIPIKSSHSRHISEALISIQSEPSFKSFSRNTTPNRLKTNLSTISESVKPDFRRKIKEGMENYINSSARKFEEKFKNDWFKKMGQTLNEHLKNTKISLEKEAENLLNKIWKDTSIKSKEIIPKLNSQKKNEPHCRNKIKKIRSYSEGNIKIENSVYIQTESINDVASQILRHAERQYMKIQEKAKKASLSKIAKEINTKVSESKHIIILNFQDTLTNVEASLKSHIENTLNNKLEEISYQNFSFSNRYIEPVPKKDEDYSFIDDIIKDNPMENDIFQKKIAGSGERNDLSQDSAFDYIESITKNYEQYRSPQAIPSKSNLKPRKVDNLAKEQSYLREMNLK